MDSGLNDIAIYVSFKQQKLQPVVLSEASCGLWQRLRAEIGVGKNDDEILQDLIKCWEDSR